MVLADPGLLLTPPPSSSPSKTPHRSYSAQIQFGRLLFSRPCTPYVIKLHCLFKDLSSFVIHAFYFVLFPLLPDELGDHRRWVPRNMFAVSFVFLIGDLIPFPRESPHHQTRG
jgi:hypothetical protein